MQEYRNALNRQQSSQLAKIQQRQQQQQQQEQEAQGQQIKIDLQQQQEIQQIQRQQEQIQKQQLEIEQNRIASKTNSYPTSDIAQIYAERHWSDKLLRDESVFLFVLSAQGVIVYCSDTCQGLTGYNAIEVVGHPIFEFIHPEDEPNFYSLLDRVFETPLRLSHIDFRWKMKTPATDSFVSMQCFGYSKPDVIPSFTVTQSNHLESNYNAFFALAQVRVPTTADVVIQLRKENQRLQQQLAQYIGNASTSSQAPSTSSVIASWMQSDAPSIPWLVPQNTSNTAAQLIINKNQSLVAMMDDPVSLSSHENETLARKTNKNTKLDSMDIDNTKKKLHDDDQKKVYVTLEEHKCSDCGSTNSPEWRKGPLGRKTLCNACGLRWAKKNKKEDSSR